MSAPKPLPPNSSFTLGPCRVNPRANTIRGPAGRTTIEPKVMAVLLRLAAEPGQVVMREQFLDEIWSREFCGDESLTRAVSLLRKALGDGRGSQAIIETVPRRGYRLLIRPVAISERPAKTVQGGEVRETGSRFPTGALATAAVLVVVLGVALVADRFQGRERLTSQGQAEASGSLIAVLPFDSQSAREADRFLAEGLADETISSLSRSESLSVIAGNTSFRYRGEDKKDLGRLVRQLKVDYVLDGSLRRSESGLRLAVQLVDARSGLTTWSRVFESTEDAIYQLPVAAAAGLLESLGKDPERVTGRPLHIPDPEAYRLFLEAQALLRLTVPLDQVVSLLEDATRRDKDFAEAWAELAMTRLYMIISEPEQGSAGFRNRDPEERLAAARAEAERALALDPNLAEAHLALVVIDYRARLLPLEEAERQFRALYTLAPENPEINTRMGMMLMELGRWQEAGEFLGRAARLDPHTPAAGGLYIQALQHTDRLREASEFIDAGLCPWFPTHFVGLEQMLASGDYEGARAWLQNTSRLAHFGLHGPYGFVEQEDQPDITEHPVYGLMVRLVALAESGDAQSDPLLPADLVAAADQGLLLHYYAAVLLGAAGVEEPVFDLVLERLMVDDLFFRAALFRNSLADLRRNPRAMAWFDVGTQLDYWLETDRWPDFCSDPALPYNCAEAALRYRGMADNR